MAENKRTLLRVKGVSSQSERALADVTAETLAVEEEALCAQPLHHIYPLGAEVAGVAAAEPRREVLTWHALRGRRAGLQKPLTRVPQRDACSKEHHVC